MDLLKPVIGGINACLMGALAGSALPTLGLMIAASSEIQRDWLGYLTVAIMPFLFVFGCALVGLIVLGLPLTLYLRWVRGERHNAYWIGGTFTGSVIPSLIVIALGGGGGAVSVIVFFGAVTGGVTGHYWWRNVRDAASMAGLGSAEDVARVFQ